MARHEQDGEQAHTSVAVPRSRGIVSGILLMALGAWGALLPLLGPHFHFGYGPDNSTFDFTAARFWLQILPGVVVFVAGLFILFGGNRITGSFWAFIACVAGAWFVVGPILADLRTAGYVGGALGGNDRQHVGAIAAFYGLGALIIFFGALTAGRLSVVGVRDLRASQKRHAARETPEQTPVYPATREVPVTTTSVRPTETPAVETLPVADTETPDVETIR